MTSKKLGFCISVTNGPGKNKLVKSIFERMPVTFHMRKPLPSDAGPFEGLVNITGTCTVLGVDRWHSIMAEELRFVITFPISKGEIEALVTVNDYSILRREGTLEICLKNQNANQCEKKNCT